MSYMEFILEWLDLWSWAQNTQDSILPAQTIRRQLSRAPEETEGEIQVLAKGCLKTMSKVNEKKTKYRFSNSSILILSSNDWPLKRTLMSTDISGCGDSK